VLRENGEIHASMAEGYSQRSRRTYGHLEFVCHYVDELALCQVVGSQTHPFHVLTHPEVTTCVKDTGMYPVCGLPHCDPTDDQPRALEQKRTSEPDYEEDAESERKQNPKHKKFTKPVELRASKHGDTP
jgi:hypothetical protein